MSCSQRDIKFLQILQPNGMDIENIPADKYWILQYLAPKEIRIFVFYCFFKDFLSKFFLYKCYINFTGEMVYPKYFYVTIDKLDYYDNLMQEAVAILDFEKLSDLKSGKIRHTFQSRKSSIYNLISLQDALLKYPEQVANIEKIIRSKCKRVWRKDSLIDFNWFVANRKPNLFELVCKKGTKFTLFEIIPCN